MDDKLAFRSTHPSPTNPAPMHANQNVGASQQRLDTVAATCGIKSGAIGVGGIVVHDAKLMCHELCLPAINCVVSVGCCQVELP